MDIEKSKPNQAIFSKLKGWFRLFALLSTVIVFSFFNPKLDNQKLKDQQTKSIVLQWYNLFLYLESKDTTAYPPRSAQRLADLGMCGYLTIDYQKTMSLSDNEAMALLNKVYSNSLAKYYTNLNINSFESIKDLENSISSTIDIADGSEDLVLNASEDIKRSIPDFFESHAENFCEVVEIQADEAPESNGSKYAFKSDNPILPEWGQKKTIVVNKKEVFCPKPYLEGKSFNKSLYSDALEIYSMSQNLTKEDVWVAEFWSDDVSGLTFSPPARWVSILNQIIQKEDVTAFEIMELYLKMGIGLYDAAVICWKNKYTHNLQRPSDFIQNNIDNNWEPFHNDPEFPAYPSGHAVFGAVGSRILEARFGNNYEMTDMSHAQRIEFVGKERTYNSFKEMAHENAYSRMIMGVHYKQDCDEGLRLGYEIADIINTTDFKSLLVEDNYHL